MTRDIQRGKRIRRAISSSKIFKAYALAAELNVSSAAVSKWQNGGEISLHNACILAELTDVSMDWLLLGRGGPDLHRQPTRTANLQAEPHNSTNINPNIEAAMISFMSIMAQYKKSEI